MCMLSIRCTDSLPQLLPLPPLNITKQFFFSLYLCLISIDTEKSVDLCPYIVSCHIHSTTITITPHLLTGTTYVRNTHTKKTLTLTQKYTHTHTVHRHTHTHRNTHIHKHTHTEKYTHTHKEKIYKQSVYFQPVYATETFISYRNDKSLYQIYKSL